MCSEGNSSAFLGSVCYQDSRSIPFTPLCGLTSDTTPITRQAATRVTSPGHNLSGESRPWLSTGVSRKKREGRPVGPLVSCKLVVATLSGRHQRGHTAIRVHGAISGETPLGLHCLPPSFKPKRVLMAATSRGEE